MYREDDILSFPRHALWRSRLMRNAAANSRRGSRRICQAGCWARPGGLMPLALLAQRRSFEMRGGLMRKPYQQQHSLSSRHCPLAVGFGHKLPFVFVDQISGSVRSDFLHVDTVAFEDIGHLPDSGDMLSGAGLEPTDAEAELVTSEGCWLLQIVTEPGSQFIQFVGVGARNVLPFQSLRGCLKDSLLNMSILVLVAHDEADVFASF